MAALNVGKVSITFDGDYDSSKQYRELTCVLYNQVSWVSKQRVPAGNIPVENSLYWQKMSERGAQGPAGQSYVGNVQIIDNLSEGGSTSVLSAEQGKILNERIEDLDTSLLKYKISLGYETVEEDLSSSILNGRWQMRPIESPEDDTTSVGAVGSQVVATKRWDGTWRSIEYDVKAGDTYKITGKGSVAARLYAVVNEDGVLVDLAPESFVATEYTLNIHQDGKMYLSGFINGGEILFSAKKVSIRYQIINDINEDINDIKEDTLDASSNISSIKNLLGYHTEMENLEASIIRGWWKMLIDGESIGSQGDVVTPTRQADPTWRCLKYPVKTGEKYYITGTGGSSARLYCLLDSDNVIQVISEPSVTKENFILNVTTDGTLYCTFSASSNYSVIREFASLGGISSQNWQRGSFEFGKTCNCNYTSPEIAGWPFPSQGERVATINSWYDELVAELPQYVSKESCDDVMASLGVEKPSAIASYPMYIYKFIPPRTPNASAFGATTSEIKRIKAFVITGTHPEWMAIWDCVNAMRLICRRWKEDANLEELRWNAEIYIIPCFNPYGIDNSSRTNENGVDLNRNAPTLDWRIQGNLGEPTYSGTTAGSEYSTKVMMHYIQAINPQVFIDHHNTNVGSGDDDGDGKNMIYTHCAEQIGLDIAGSVISQMTRKWKMRYTNIFPSVDSDPNVLFGYTSFDTIIGSIGRYATEQGILGSTYESNTGYLYRNGEYSIEHRRQNDELASTCATEGFLNYLIRSLKVYSECIGVKE